MKDILQNFKRICSWEGVSFLLMIYMLYTKIYGDGRYMTLTLMMGLCIIPVYKKKYWDGMTSSIFIFSIIYSLTNYFHHTIESNFYLLYFAIAPMIFYLFGKIIIEKVHSDNELIALWWIVAFSLGAIIYSIVGFTGSITIGVEENARSFYLNPNGDQKLSATLVGVFVSLGLIGLGTCLYVSKNVFSKISWLGIFFLSVSIVVFFINRTGLVVAAICVIVMAYFRGSGKFISLVKYGLVLLSIIFLVYISGLIDLNVFDVYNSRAQDPSTAEDRFNRWDIGLSYIIKYPFGWSHIQGVFDGYIHNTWIDAARKGGVTCFILLVSMTFVACKNLYKLLMQTRTPFVLFSTGLFCCFIMSCMVNMKVG